MFIGEDSAIMTEETAHLIINLCSLADNPDQIKYWREGQGSAYVYKQIKEQRERRDTEKMLRELKDSVQIIEEE